MRVAVADLARRRREGTGVSANETLAGYSNLLIYSSMAVYAGAFGAFATDLAVSGRQASATVAARVREAVLVAAGAGRPGRDAAVPAPARRSPTRLPSRYAAGPSASRCR